MKTTLLLSALLTLAAFTSSIAAVTGRSADSSIAGTEKLLSDSSGTDTFITVSTLRDAMALTGGLTASGSTAFDFSGSTGAFKTSTGLNTFGGSGHAFAAVLYPSTNDGAALGDATHGFSDLFLASGAVIDINNTNWVATHTSGILTVGTGDLRVTTAGTNTASVVTVGGTQTLAAKTLTSPVIGSGLTASGSGANTFAGSTGTFITSTGANTFKGSSHSFDAKLFPTTDDGAALGDTTHHFSDLFLASGAVLNFNNGNVAVTHSSGILTMGTGELRITTAGTNAASVPTLGSTSTLTNKTLTSPVIGSGLTASGSGANTFAGSTGTFITSTGINTFKGSAHNFDAVLQPTTNDAAALGTTSLGFSDLHLATGATVNVANGNWLATHTSGILTVGTGDLRVTTAGTNTASVVTVGGTQTLASKKLTSPVIATGLTASGSAANTFAGSTGTFITSTGANTFKGSAHNFDAVLQPTTNDVAALGTTTLGFSDLFLASGGTLHFANTDWVATHTTGVLTVGTGNVIISTAGTAAGSVVTNNGTQTLTNKTLTSPTLTGAKVTPNVETITGNGAITIQSGTVLLTKGSAAAITLAAPSSQDGTIITITSTTAFAHVVTVTGGMWDGTATTNTTATFPAVQGGAITLIAFGTDWYVLNLQGVVCAP